RPHLGAEAAAELDIGPHHEGPALRHVEAEAGAQVDRALEPDVGVGMAQEHPAAAQGGGQAWPELVAQAAREVARLPARPAGGAAPERAPILVSHARKVRLSWP